MQIIKEIEAYFSSELCEIEPEIYFPIGKANSDEKSILQSFIKKAISNQTSHSITGVYTMGNMESNPHRCYAFIGKNPKSGILLNVDPIRSWMITIDYHASEKHYREFRQLLSRLTKVFLFVSGNRLISKANSLYEEGVFRRKLENNVYKLKNFDSSKITYCNSSVDIIKHPTDQDNYSKVKKFYDYSEQNFQDVPETHVVLELDNEIVAGARCNEEVDDYAVVGGVHTRIDKRNQKFGFTVSYHLIKELQSRFNHIFLETDVDNFPAIKIYEKLGFTKIGTSAFFEKGLDMISEVIGDRDY